MSIFGLEFRCLTCAQGAGYTLPFLDLEEGLCELLKAEFIPSSQQPVPLALLYFPAHLPGTKALPGPLAALPEAALSVTIL